MRRFAWSSRLTQQLGDTPRRSRVGLLSVYFSLFDEQMPPAFRSQLEAAAASYRDALARRFDVVFPGVVASDAEGRAAGETFRRAEIDVVVFAPTMAAPPSYAASALSLNPDVPMVVWNAPLVDTLESDLDQTKAHEHTTAISTVMLGNVLFRAGVQPVVITAMASDARNMERVFSAIESASKRQAPSRVLLRIGEGIPGYLDVEADDEDLDQVGFRQHRVSVDEFVETFRGVTDAALGELQQEIGELRWEGEPDPRSLRVASTMLELAERYGVAGGTVNCHGAALRFNPDVGICACLGVSLSTVRGRPFSCTGDLPTAVALVMGRAVAGAALYGEIYAPELSTGLALFSNGGEGDSSWSVGPVRLVPTQHYPGTCGRGTALAWSPRPGPCTLLSLSPGPFNWRGAWMHAEAVESRYPAMDAPNIMLSLSQDDPTGAFDRWTMSGATHHLALLPGHVGQVLSDALTKAGIEPYSVV